MTRLQRRKLKIQIRQTGFSVCDWSSDVCSSDLFFPPQRESKSLNLFQKRRYEYILLIVYTVHDCMINDAIRKCVNRKVFKKHNSIIQNFLIRSDQIRSVTQSCPTLCNPMNLSTPGLPVHHQLPEFTQTHVHRVSDAIQPSHPLSSPSPPAPNPSQHQSLFQ